jgi:hypothetical protein
MTAMGGEEKVEQETELYTSALMIGPWLFEWNETELCIPKKCISNAAILSADIDSITSLENFEEKLDQLSEKIIEWNISMGYRKTVRESDKSAYGNSQDFVESLLSSMNVKLELPEPLTVFLENIKQNGFSKLEFTMNKEFQKKFKQKTSSVCFSKHSELDDFVQSLLLIDFKFMFDHKGEYQFLKSLDRAFWMKHINIEDEIKLLEQQLSEIYLSDEKKKSAKKREIVMRIEENENVKPKWKGKKECCPFHNPLKTQSILL